MAKSNPHVNRNYRTLDGLVPKTLKMDQIIAEQVPGYLYARQNARLQLACNLELAWWYVVWTTRYVRHNSATGGFLTHHHLEPKTKAKINRIRHNVCFQRAAII